MSPRQTPGAPRRAFIVHDVGHVTAVLQAATIREQPVTLRSVAGAAAWLGAAGFRAMVLDTAAAFVKADYMYVLDCGSSPGLAMNAIRHGVAAIRLDVPTEIKCKIAEMAIQAGTTLDDDNTPALDLLGVADVATACDAWLAGT